MEENKKVQIIGKYGALLSVIEVGLGSLLHSLRVPFTGKFLSLNQGYLLCRVAIESKESHERWMSYTVSNIAAVLKSLSPAGQKLGPMLSLSMQGLLFNLGTAFLGTNPVGLAVGMILLSFWSFVQPLITYYLFFGEKLFNAAQYVYEKTLPWHHLRPEHLIWIFGGLVVLKAIIALGLGLVAWKTQGQSQLQEKFATFAKVRPPLQDKRSPLYLALRDLLRPLFLISLAITGVFLFYSQHPWAQIIWYLLRPVAIGFIFFYFSRTLTLDRLIKKMEGGRYDSFSKGCQDALNRVRKII